jgi:hypothetical protein
MSITTYGLQQIKKELQHLPQEQLAELCLRLIRYKKRIRNYWPICCSNRITSRVLLKA